MDSAVLFPDIAIADAEINLPGEFSLRLLFFLLFFISIVHSTSFSLGNVEGASLAVCRAFPWAEYKVSSLELRVVFEDDVNLESCLRTLFWIALKHLLGWQLLALKYFCFWFSLR